MSGKSIPSAEHFRGLCLAALGLRFGSSELLKGRGPKEGRLATPAGSVAPQRGVRSLIQWCIWAIRALWRPQCAQTPDFHQVWGAIPAWSEPPTEGAEQNLQSGLTGMGGVAIMRNTKRTLYPVSWYGKSHFPPAAILLLLQLEAALVSGA